MYRQTGKLDAVMIGVGAAFRFHSGEVTQAPRWMMKSGLEWCFRLLQEPETALATLPSYQPCLCVSVLWAVIAVPSESLLAA